MSFLLLLYLLVHLTQSTLLQLASLHLLTEGQKWSALELYRSNRQVELMWYCLLRLSKWAELSCLLERCQNNTTWVWTHGICTAPKRFSVVFENTTEACLYRALIGYARLSVRGWVSWEVCCCATLRPATQIGCRLKCRWFPAGISDGYTATKHAAGENMQIWHLHEKAPYTFSKFKLQEAEGQNWSVSQERGIDRGVNGYWQNQTAFPRA